MSVKQENRWKKHLHEKAEDAERKHHDAVTIGIYRAYRAPIAAAKTNAATKSQILAWMMRAANESIYGDATSLAEAANAALELPNGSMDDPDHWVWELAIRAVEAA